MSAASVPAPQAPWTATQNVPWDDGMMGGSRIGNGRNLGSRKSSEFLAQELERLAWGFYQLWDFQGMFFSNRFILLTDSIRKKQVLVNF